MLPLQQELLLKREVTELLKNNIVCNEAFGGMGGGKNLTDEEIRKGTVHSPDMRVHSPDERKTAVIFSRSSSMIW